MTRVRYFAAAKEAVGTDSEDLPLEGLTVAAARDALRDKHPALDRVLRQCRFALAQRFVDDTAVVSAGAELAVIPPVAGG